MCEIVRDITLKIMFLLGVTVPLPAACWTRIQSFISHISKYGCNVTVLSVVTPWTIHKINQEIESSKNKDVRFFKMFALSFIDCFHTILINLVFSFIFSSVYVLISMPTIVIFSVPPGGVPIGAFLACKLLRRKTVFDYRDEWEDYLISKSKSPISRLTYNLLKKITALFYSTSDFVITVTATLVNSLKKRGVKNVFLIPNGADTRIFRPMDKKEVRMKLNLPYNNFVVAYSGDIVTAYYRLDIVIQALKLFMGESEIANVILILIGRDLKVKEVLDFSNKVGVNTMYLGAKYKHRQLAEILACADVGVIPYDDNRLWKNALPSKLFEYCACAVPVIATVHKHSILAELITEHEVGLTTPPMNVKNLARALEKIYTDTKFQKEAGKRARKLVEEYFDRVKSADKFLSLLASL